MGVRPRRALLAHGEEPQPPPPPPAAAQAAAEPAEPHPTLFPFVCLLVGLFV